MYNFFKVIFSLLKAVYIQITWLHQNSADHDQYILIMKLHHCQGSHRLGKYLNLEDFPEKSLKMKSVLKSTGKSLKTLKSP